MQHEAQLELRFVVLEDPVLDGLDVLVQVELLGELECVQDDLCRPSRKSPAQVLEEAVSGASVPVGPQKFARLDRSHLDDIMPDTLHLLAVSLDWLVCTLLGEKHRNRVHLVFLVEILGFFELDLN